MSDMNDQKLLKLIFFIMLSVLISVLHDGNLTAQQKSLKQITFSDSTHDGYPYWSPDGKFIIYSSGKGSFCTTKIIPVEGGQSKVVTNFFSQHCRISPDGEYIVFDAARGTAIQISTINGANPVRIVPEDITIHLSGMPVWSPDGKKIAFKSKMDLYTLELATGKASRIINLGSRKVIPFDWTSDSKYIVADARDTSSREAHIWLISTADNSGRQITFGEGRQIKPSLSPDNSMFVFTKATTRYDHNLWISSIEGGEPVQITFQEGDDSNPGFDVEASWSPDGRKIAFTSTRTGYWAIWIMELDLDFIKKKLDLPGR
jgi:Tol biopolymer transport system component